MKKHHFIALTITGILSAPVIANDFPVCKSDLTKQMKRFEKSEFTVPRKQPIGKLKEFSRRQEILCPWQIEFDFNGDRQKDWIGIISRNQQYELVAYLSASPKDKLQVLHSYRFFPENSYLKILRNPGYQRNQLASKKYQLAEITLNDSSRIYAYRKGEMVVIHNYLDETSVENIISPEALEIKQKAELIEEVKRIEKGFKR